MLRRQRSPTPRGGDLEHLYIWGGKAAPNVQISSFSPSSPYPFSPASGEKGRKTTYLYLFGGFAAKKIQDNPIPRPWGRGVDVSSAERLGGETLRA